MRSIYAVTFSCLAALSSCSNATDKPTTDAATATPTAARQPVTSRLDSAGTAALVTTLAAYYQLKDAMVGTNPGKAKDAAAALAIKADTMKAIASRQGNNDSLVAYMDTVIINSRSITTITDPECEKQRVAFEPVSNAMYRTLKKVELKNMAVYHQYCPMAFNDKGAYWLSDVADIKNPYFGKKMLECGEVTDSL